MIDVSDVNVYIFSVYFSNNSVYYPWNHVVVHLNDCHCIHMNLKRKTPLSTPYTIVSTCFMTAS